jgi:hypothetical protein
MEPPPPARDADADVVAALTSELPPLEKGRKYALVSAQWCRAFLEWRTFDEAKAGRGGAARTERPPPPPPFTNDEIADPVYPELMRRGTVRDAARQK